MLNAQFAECEKMTCVLSLKHLLKSNTHTEKCTYHKYITLGIFINWTLPSQVTNTQIKHKNTTSILEAPPFVPSSHSSPLMLSLTLHVNGNMQYVLFCVWLLLLNTVFEKGTHVVEQSYSSFSFLYSILLCKYYKMHSSISWLMNILMWWVVLLWTFKFMTFGERMYTFLLEM